MTVDRRKAREISPRLRTFRREALIILIVLFALLMFGFFLVPHRSWQHLAGLYVLITGS